LKNFIMISAKDCWRIWLVLLVPRDPYACEVESLRRAPVLREHRINGYVNLHQATLSIVKAAEIPYVGDEGPHHR
jgi:hypothetical protein